MPLESHGDVPPEKKQENHPAWDARRSSGNEREDGEQGRALEKVTSLEVEVIQARGQVGEALEDSRRQRDLHNEAQQKVDRAVQDVVKAYQKVDDGGRNVLDEYYEKWINGGLDDTKASWMGREIAQERARLTLLMDDTKKEVSAALGRVVDTIESFYRSAVRVVGLDNSFIGEGHPEHLVALRNAVVQRGIGEVENTKVTVAKMADPHLDPEGARNELGTKAKDELTEAQKRFLEESGSSIPNEDVKFTAGPLSLAGGAFLAARGELDRTSK
jgi:hypothetical protein